jgi:hypothetical protein
MYNGNSCFCDVKIQSNDAKDCACELPESGIIVRTTKNMAPPESKVGKYPED